MSNINWIAQKELDYIIEKKYLDIFPNLEKSLTEPRFTISDLNINPRDATYWDKKDILPKLKTKSTTRRKYTLVQAIWIKIIQQLREFDISLKQIKKIKESILGQEVNMRDLWENEEVRSVVEKLALQSGKTSEELHKLMNDIQTQEEMEKEHINYFEMAILSTMINRRDVSYLIFKDAECLIYSFDKHNRFVKEIEGFNSLIKQPHISISISKAYSQLITEWSEEDWFKDISIVTSEEQKIIDLLRDEKTAELKIYKKGNQLDRVIQVSKENKIALEDFADYIVKNGYQTVKISTRQGKVVSFRNELSKKL